MSVEGKMKNASDALNNAFKLVEQIEAECYKDVVEEDKMDEEYKLTDSKRDKMTVGELKQHFKSFYDKYLEKTISLQQQLSEIDKLYDYLNQKNIQSFLLVQDILL